MGRGDARGLPRSEGVGAADLRKAQLSLFARRSRFNAAATLVNSLLIGVLLLGVAPGPALGLWVGIQLVTCGWLLYRTHRRRRSPRGSQRGLRRATFYSALAGSLLGSSAFLASSASQLQLMVVTINIGAMASAASATLASIPSAARAYVLCSLLPTVTFLLLRGQLEYTIWAGLVLCMVYFLIRNARVTYEGFLEGVERAREVQALRERFRSEQTEWLDLSLATEAFALLDSDWRFLLHNVRFERMVRPAKVERGIDYREALAGSARKPQRIDGEAVTADTWIALRTGLADPDSEFEEEYEDGRIFRVATRELDGGRRVVVATDVTALKRAERSLRTAALERAETQRLESVATMAAGVAHDFNNLLMAIGGAAEALVRDPERTQRRELLDEIRSSVRSGSELTRQLLDFGRRPTARPRPIEINELLRRDRSLLRRLVPESISFELQLDPELHRVELEPERFSQVVANLVINARDASSDGDAIRIWTRNLGGDEVEVGVADTGVGIDAETQRRMFEPFFSTKGQRGSGLGLAAVEEVVRQSHGSILVSSVPERGTRIAIHLPRCDGPVDASPAPTSKPLAVPAPVGRVLVVDDQEGVRRAVSRLVAHLGYEVEVAGGPFEALELVRRQDLEVSLLLTDVVMPEMTGPELAQALGRAAGSTPVLFMSGYDSQMLDGIDEAHILRKPFTSEELVAAIQRRLSEAGGTPAPQR